MNIRLDNQIEQRLNFFAEQLHVTKTDLIKPYVLKLLEDLEDYHHAVTALQDEGSIPMSLLENEFANVAD